ncbi:hypothetical protein [Blastococcus sp. SYSU D00820]
MRRSLPHAWLRRPPGRRARRWGLRLTGGSALVLAAVVAWQSGYAAFTVSTPPVTSTWSTGTVALGDDDAGTALFTVTGLRPGASSTRCITVTSTGSAPSAVRLYGTGRTTSRSLSAQIRLAVVVGTGGSSATCSGFSPSAELYRGTLAAFPAAGYGTGVGGWNPAGGTESRTYQVTYSLPADAAASAAGGSASLGLTWEARST